MAPPRLEIDLQRLLLRCESMANEQQNEKMGLNWRLEKYVCTLQSQVGDLSKMKEKPNPDTMNDYTRRVNFLKGFIETERKNSLSEKALASQQLARPISHMSSSSRSEKTPVELHIKTKARIEKKMRDELLDSRQDPKGIRNRRPGEESNKEKEESIDSVLQYHQNMQEKLQMKWLGWLRV